MTEYFDYLTNLLAPSDDRRKLVLPREFVEADSKVFKVRRQLVPPAVTLFLLLVVADPRLNLLHNHLAVRAQSLEQFDRVTVSVLEQGYKQITGFDQAPSVFVRMLECV